MLLSVASGCGGNEFKDACARWGRSPGKSYTQRAEFAKEMSELTDGQLSRDFKAVERTLRALSVGDVERAEDYEVQTKISESRIKSRMSECLK